VVCRDVTDQSAYLKAVESQNNQLLEITWHQSHIVHAPLTRIIGLVDILLAEQTEANLKEILPMLEKSAEDFDKIVHDIVAKIKIINGDPSGGDY
jgi:signal transduction histidine kinase